MNNRNWKLLAAGMVLVGAATFGGQPTSVAFAEDAVETAEAVAPVEPAAASEAVQTHAYKTMTTEQRRFMLAVAQGDAAAVESILASGTVDVNGVYTFYWSDGITPLGLAIAMNQTQVQSLLLEAGADAGGYETFTGQHIDYLALAIQKLPSVATVTPQPATTPTQPQTTTPVETPANVTTPQETSGTTATHPDSSVTIGKVTQSAQTVRNTSLTRFARLCTKYASATDAAFEALNVGMPDVLGTDAAQKAAAIQSMKTNAAKLRTQMTAMEMVDPLEGVQGFNESEQQLFTDGFGSIYATNQALAEVLEYIVAHPDDDDHDALVAKIKAVFQARDAQKSKLMAIQALFEETDK